MKIHLRTRSRITIRQKFARIVIATSVLSLVVAFSLFLTQSFHSEPAYAWTCENSYVLNWSDTTTWDVDCGTVNASNWSVKGTTCNYWSPVFTASGPVGGPARELAIAVRINQSGNLDGNDTAFVYMYVNNSIVNSKVFLGAGSPAVFIYIDTLMIPSGGTYYVNVKCKNDRTNELWQVKNGDVTTCLKALNPLPITLTAFSAKATADQKIRLEWSTQTEVNNDYFTIERTNSGQNYIPLTKIKGSGSSNTPKHYYFVDEHPLKGINYYKLKQTDFDGTTATFTVVCARVDTHQSTTAVLKIAPNPISSEFSAGIEADRAGPASLELVSLSGSVVYKSSFELLEGYNYYPFSLKASLTPGQYLVRVTDGEGLKGAAKVLVR